MTATTNRPTTTPTGVADAVGAVAGTATTTRPKKPVLAATGGPVKRPSAAAHLSDADVERLGQELDALRDRIIATRGAKDAAYIRRVIRVQRTLEVAGRATLLLSRKKTAFVAGTAMLSVAKILENMEIGHNVLHHTWTNVLGKDKDVGYSTLRMAEDQPWRPHNILNPVINGILAPFFEWGIAIYDLELEAVQEGEKSKEDLKKDLKALGRKVVRQFTKDYAATPLAAVPFGSGKQALLGTFTANAIRNVWAHSVIFCGHFPDGVDVFTEEEIEGETRGDWYIRQMLGSANISGSKLMHLMTGNLSHQIEHHCFPDLPSNRYHEVAVEVREICQRYGLPYTTGPMPKQVYQAWAKVFRLALPNRPKPLPKAAVNAAVPPRRVALPLAASVG